LEKEGEGGQCKDVAKAREDAKEAREDAMTTCDEAEGTCKKLRDEKYELERRVAALEAQLTKVKEDEHPAETP